MRRTLGFLFFVALILARVPSLAAQRSNRPSAKFKEYCSLYNLLDSEVNSTFSSRSLMYYSTIGRVDGGDPFLYSSNCNGGDYFAVFGEGHKIWNRWDSFFSRLEGEKDHVLEIEFEGKIDFADSYLFGHLGWARAQIILSRIVSIRNLTGSSMAVKPDFKKRTPLIDQISGLNAKCLLFLSSLVFIPPESEDLNHVLAPTFVFLTRQGKSKTKSEYLAKKNGEIEFRPIKSSAMSQTFVNKTGNLLTIQGTIKIIYQDASENSIVCEMVFELENDEWNLKRATIK